MSMRMIAASIIATALAGCASVQLSPEARQVRTITPAVATMEKCKFLSITSARGVALEGGMQAAQIKIRNQVASMGGNAMVITARDLEQSGQFTHGNVEAEAYRCP